MAILKCGLSGEPVKVMQEKLGVTADGIVSPGTEAALKEYQKKHGLHVDGVAGPDTFTQMGLFELVLLRPGTSGEAVKKLQQALGVTTDGHFGPVTQKALQDFQAKNGLMRTVSLARPTLAKMSGFKEMTAEVVKKSEASGRRCGPGCGPRRDGRGSGGAQAQHLGPAVRPTAKA